jgi:DNA-binding winged helix-turn-helix (wHTH) protein/CheY-like chemotaxis protein
MTDTLPNVFRLGSWRVLRDQNRLENLTPQGAHSERLEPKAMDVLCLLAANAGQTVTREDLLEKVWQGRLVMEGALSRVVLALRNSLGDDAKSPIYIETVPKRGYRLLVTPSPDEPATADATAFFAAVTQEAAREIIVPSASTSPRRLLGWAAAGVFALAFMTWLAWPRIQLERATFSGLGAMEFRGEAAGDRGLLREDLRHMRAGRVLWVDDQPSGNEREITTLEHAGLVVDTVTSNAAAAEQMRGREYDLLISDIRRPHPEAIHAGLELPRTVVPDRNRLPPLIYYAHTVSAPRTADGYPVTNKPCELFHLVADVVRWRQGSPALQPLKRTATDEPLVRASIGTQ